VIYKSHGRVFEIEQQSATLWAAFELASGKRWLFEDEYTSEAHAIEHIRCVTAPDYDGTY
jgi:hypothetical protein